jgi:hypothetical protein
MWLMFEKRAKINGLMLTVPLLRFLGSLEMPTWLLLMVPILIWHDDVIHLVQLFHCLMLLWRLLVPSRSLALRGRLTLRGRLPSTTVIIVCHGDRDNIAGALNTC